MLHWLLQKRTKGLIGEENRNKNIHIKLLILYILLIGFDGLVFYIFSVQFFRDGSKINDIYIMIGFEVSNLPIYPSIHIYIIQSISANLCMCL